MNTISNQKAFAHKKVGKPHSARYNSHLKRKQETVKRQKQKLDQIIFPLSRSLRSKNNLIPAFDSEQSLQKAQKNCDQNREDQQGLDWVNSVNLANFSKINDKYTVGSLKVQSIMTSCTQIGKSSNLKKKDEYISMLLPDKSKFSKGFEQLKVEHQKQREIFQLVVKEKQMHRLGKIHQTQQAKYLYKATRLKQAQF